ncbi:MAG: DUF2163 domain-containing protein [Rhizobiaceae bacterium]|nr:DUF2163 domain-containing protein [Rhizobiaceae bacterium]
MRNIPSSFSNHLKGQSTTICRCWKIIRRDGRVLGFTEHDRGLNVAGTLYQPMSGMDSTISENSIGLAANGVEVLGALSSEKLSQKDIRADKYDGARVEVLVVNWMSPQEYLLENVYHVGEIMEEDGLFKANLQTLESQLDQTQGEHFVRQCQANLGDERCAIDLSSDVYTGFGSVINYDDFRQISVSGITPFSEGWFSNGLLLWLSGENEGISIEISRHSKDGSDTKLQIWKTLPAPPVSGDTFKITAGCNKKFSACKTKFSNSLNFRGFPHMPGADFIFSYVSNSNNLDGGVIVK